MLPYKIHKFDSETDAKFSALKTELGLTSSELMHKLCSLYELEHPSEFIECYSRRIKLGVDALFLAELSILYDYLSKVVKDLNL